MKASVVRLQEQAEQVLEAQAQSNESPSGDQPEGQSSDTSPDTSDSSQGAPR